VGGPVIRQKPSKTCWNAEEAFMPGFAHQPLAWLATAAVTCSVALPAAAVDSASEKTGPKAYEQAVAKAVEYLRTTGQAEDGSFSANSGPGVTAIVTAALLRSGRTPQDPLVAKALRYLEGLIQPDRGIYQPGSRHRNYETCLGLMAFSEANASGQYKSVVAGAEAFLKRGQYSEKDGVQPANIAFGGAGYGDSERPDLSNTSFLVDALKDAGAGPEDEALKRALVFISRCQNLESEYNTTEFPAKNPDGGFYYTVAGGGRSMAGNTDNGGLRSYGSMTYAGLKSMIYCGASADDPRVKAAVEWARKHYTVEDNPGMGDAGLYYYYQLFAKALSAMNLPTITDADGHVHDWRKELIAALVERQRADGAWVNRNSRWLEGDANLVTGYALLALSYCRPDKP
jgi:squalene-hopene/tetraprenyl-beta-curcumene cyclase